MRCFPVCQPSFPALRAPSPSEALLSVDVSCPHLTCDLAPMHTPKQHRWRRMHRSCTYAVAALTYIVVVLTQLCFPHPHLHRRVSL